MKFAATLLTCAIVGVAQAQGSYYPGRPTYMWFNGFEPQTTFSSANHAFTCKTDLKGTLSLKRGNAVMWTIDWPQNAAPEKVFIGNDGRRTILMDSLGGSGDILPQPDGNGIKLVILDEKGKVLKAYKASDIRLPQEFLEDDVGTYTMHPSLEAPDNSILLDQAKQTISFLMNGVVDKGDGEEGLERYQAVAFDLANGDQIPVSPQEAIQITAPFLASVRNNLHSSNLDFRTLACRNVAALLDRQSIETLKKLLDDKSVTGNSAMEDRAPAVAIHDVQTSAGYALAAIVGKDAAPLIMPHLDRAKGSQDLYDWLNDLQVAGVEPDQQTIDRMEASHEVLDRRTILRVANDIDPKVGIIIARKQVRDRNKDVRWDAMAILSREATPTDVPLLKSLLNDPNLGDFAVDGLITLKPAAIDLILHKIAKEDNDAGWDATFELAREGDKNALHQTVQWLDYFANHPDEVSKGPGSMMTTQEVTQILGTRNPPGAKAALEKALSIPDMWWDSDVHVRGALVQLGEQKYLRYILSVAQGQEPADSPILPERRGDEFRRSEAVQWLGDLNDRDSIPYLQQLAGGTNTCLRKASMDALKKMNAVPLPSTQNSATLGPATEVAEANSNSSRQTPTKSSPRLWLTVAAVLAAATPVCIFLVRLCRSG